MEKLVKSVDCLNCEPVSRSCVSQQQLSGWLFFFKHCFWQEFAVFICAWKIDCVEIDRAL